MPTVRSTNCFSAAETHFDAVSLDDTLQLFGSNDEPSKWWKFLDEVCNSESKNPISSQSVTDSSCLGAAELLAKENSNSMVGTATTQLDSLDELIKSDHVYVKPSPSPSPASDSGPKSLMEVCDILPCDAADEGVFVDEEAIVSAVSSTVIVPDISNIATQEYDDIKDNDAITDNSSSNIDDDSYDFDPLALLQDILQESVDSQEGKETNDILQLADLEQLDTSDLAEENNPISSLMLDMKLRKSCDSTESEMKIPVETTYMDQFSDSASDSGINSEPSNPGSPYQDQLTTIPFNDMDPMDDCMLPEIFPCLV
ncbi:uncharacterized protein LOC106880675 isoform X2 [Octopus bimaculoides]|uniref:uncharacterized protein LOC106880675 isoform X2 n=1 Tax=Octopus bimaculoides TaxID=37653 RepID=UPI00071CCFBF|nr:uncharacterized protein LOC106880675 isoform X2 [Octopus bimaculoides]|eukprot:XP_014786215.1 PREDICTED: uncharacterized protein LOC106880675 isoform X2 [Octopus bimaculoides]